jgi:integrase
MFFKNAVKLGLIPTSPFDGISQKPGDPGKRWRYVSVAEAERLIEAASNVWWRTIIALARFAGLRCPSEVLSLRWDGIDWARGTMRVISPKTDCHDSGGQRTAPIFARLRPYLDEAREAAAEGQTHVIPEGLYLPAANGPRGWNGCNVRTTFEKVIRRAGLEVWPRPFHNLRASCETDLVREYPIPTVCKWLGNTVAVATRHYVDVSDEDVRRAAGLPEAGNPVQQPRRAGPVEAHNARENRGRSAPGNPVQNPVQQALGTPRKRSQQEMKNPGFPGVCEGLLSVATPLVEDSGLEPLTF